MAARFIGVARGDQPRDHRHHLADVFRGAGFRHTQPFGRAVSFDCGPFSPQRIHVGMIPGDGFLGPLADQVLQGAGGTGLLTAQRLGVDLVVDVGKVADVSDVLRPVDMAQKAVQDVKDDDGPRVAKMGAVIDRRAADIHPHIGRIDRLEILFPAGLGIGQADRHHVSRPCEAADTRRGTGFSS